MRDVNEGTAIPLLKPHETRWHEILSIAIMKRAILAPLLSLLKLKAIYSFKSFGRKRSLETIFEKLISDFDKI